MTVTLAGFSCRNHQRWPCLDHGPIQRLHNVAPVRQSLLALRIPHRQGLSGPIHPYWRRSLCWNRNSDPGITGGDRFV